MFLLFNIDYNFIIVIVCCDLFQQKNSLNPFFSRPPILHFPNLNNDLVDYYGDPVFGGVRLRTNDERKSYNMKEQRKRIKTIRCFDDSYFSVKYGIFRANRNSIDSLLLQGKILVNSVSMIYNFRCVYNNL